MTNPIDIVGLRELFKFYLSYSNIEVVFRENRDSIPEFAAGEIFFLQRNIIHPQSFEFYVNEVPGEHIRKQLICKGTIMQMKGFDSPMFLVSRFIHEPNKRIVSMITEVRTNQDIEKIISFILG